MWTCVTCHRFLWYPGWFHFVLFNVLVICLFIISSPNRLMPTALWFEQQEACNSVTHGVMIMSRALAGIHYLSYVSLNFSTHAINSFTKRTFYFQPFSVMAAHPIKLHPSLAEPIIGVQVLHVTSGIFSINVLAVMTILAGSWTQTPIAMQCCWPLQLEMTLLSAGRVHLWGPMQHRAETSAPLPRLTSSAERWDAGAKAKVLQKRQHSFKSLWKMAQGMFRFLCTLMHDAAWTGVKCWSDSFFCWSTLVCHE